MNNMVMKSRPNMYTYEQLQSLNGKSGFGSGIGIGHIFVFLLAVAIPLGGGILSGFYGMKLSKKEGDVEKNEKNKNSKKQFQSDWYDGLNKPSWNPPKWLFGPAWTVLYILMGIASYIVWLNSSPEHPAILPLIIYGLQLAVNFAWTPVFFGAQRPDIALILIVTLWFMIIITIVLFYTVNSLAMYLMIPYLLWVTYATSLNAYIVYKN